MKNNNLNLIVIIFLLLTLLHIISGVLLFTYKIGYSFETVSNYYLGNEEQFIMAKSLYGLLETTIPHLVAQVSIAFIVAHFLLFIKEPTPYKLLWGYSIIIFAFLDIVSPYLVLMFGEIFVWLKIFSFICFEFSMFIVLLILFLEYINK